MLFRSFSSQIQLFKPVSHQQQTLPASASEEYAYKQRRENILSFVELYRKRKTYDFGFGLLSFQAFKIHPADASTPAQRRDSMRLKVSFLPPWWMSRTALQVTIDLPGQSSTICTRPRLSLQPTTINQSPKLLAALDSFDLLQLRHLFDTNQARPNDMVWDLVMNEPVTLVEVSLPVNGIPWLFCLLSH